MKEDLVYVYRNLHKKCYSIRKKGKVIAHREIMVVEYPRFIVQPAGHARVLREKRKNVHAFVKGTWSTASIGKVGSEMTNAKLVKYDPYQMDCFFYAEDHEPIYAAKRAILTSTGVYVD